MTDIEAVKKLQKHGEFDRALQEYLDLYSESTREGDLFASGLFLDEIVQTILLKAGRSVSEPELRRQLTIALSRSSAVMDVEAGQQVEDDIEIAIRKRFPEQYKVQEFQEPKKRPNESLS